MKRKPTHRNPSARRTRRRPEPVARRKVLVVDDHAVVREGLRATIDHEPDLTVCCTAENASQALEAVSKFQPDLVLADITLPGRNGLELIKDLRAMQPRLPVLILSMHDESLYAERVLRAGGRGYITKEKRPAELLRAIRHVLGGHMYVSSEISERILKAFSGVPGDAPASPIETLSDRQFEILQLIAAGKTPREIGRQLRIAPKTVAVHNANIRAKLQIKSTTELVRFAVQWEDLQKLAPG